jgi:hypothetical protein
MSYYDAEYGEMERRDAEDAPLRADEQEERDLQWGYAVEADVRCDLFTAESTVPLIRRIPFSGVAARILEEAA